MTKAKILNAIYGMSAKELRQIISSKMTVESTDNVGILALDEDRNIEFMKINLEINHNILPDFTDFSDIDAIAKSFEANVRDDARLQKMERLEVYHETDKSRTEYDYVFTTVSILFSLDRSNAEDETEDETDANSYQLYIHFEKSKLDEVFKVLESFAAITEVSFNASCEDKKEGYKYLGINTSDNNADGIIKALMPLGDISIKEVA